MVRTLMRVRSLSRFKTATTIEIGGLRPQAKFDRELVRLARTLPGGVLSPLRDGGEATMYPCSVDVDTAVRYRVNGRPWGVYSPVGLSSFL